MLSEFYAFRLYRFVASFVELSVCVGGDFAYRGERTSSLLQFDFALHLGLSIYLSISIAYSF